VRIAILIAALAVFLSANVAWCADSSVRISRPTETVSKFTHCFGKVPESAPAFSTTSSAIPICSSDEDKSSVENYTCCDITSKYFSIKIAGPSQHFGLWLRLNLYPTLCHSVLCQRQCALNGYQSCNALGGERTLIEQLVDNSGGDCSGHESCCGSTESNVSPSKNNQINHAGVQH
jgi:hypothetical protein